MTQPSGYAPPAQREVVAEMFTTAGWIQGAFQLPALRIFTEYLNHPHDFFKLKNVRLPGVEKPIPFFALHRDSIIFILVQPAEGILGPSAAKRKTDVSCVFASGVISGTLELVSGVRVSDFLLQKTHFFYLTDCTTYAKVGGQNDIRRDVPIGIVNARKVIGVSEPRFV
jgi:hypothetical protein